MAEKKKEEKKALLHDTYLYNVQQGGRFTTMEIAQKGILEWNNSHKLFVLQIYFCETTQIMTSFFFTSEPPARKRNFLMTIYNFYP